MWWICELPAKMQLQQIHDVMLTKLNGIDQDIAFGSYRYEENNIDCNEDCMLMHDNI